MFYPQSGILQFMSQISNTSQNHYGDNMSSDISRVRYQYPSLHAFFINSMHEQQSFEIVCKYSLDKILAKFMNEANKEFLTESFELGDYDSKNFIISLIKTPGQVKYINDFFYKKFENEIKKIWESAKEKFEEYKIRGDYEY